MDKDQTNRIARFLNDKQTAKIIEDFLLDSFTSPVQKESSVEEKAAEWLSIQKLKRAWKELKNYQSNEESESIVGTQIGM